MDVCVYKHVCVIGRFVCKEGVCVRKAWVGVRGRRVCEIGRHV